MTKAQLELKVRSLERRLALLETRHARSQRPRAPRPADTIIAARERLWHRFLLLQVGHGSTTKLAFCVKHHLGHPSDFSRFLSASGKRGIAEGSATARRYYDALHQAIRDGEARKRSGFHGNLASFHAAAAPTQ
jgi:hypothetical protein